MTMAHRVAKSKSDTFFVAHDCHPQTIAVVQTRARPLGIEVVVGDPAKDLDGRQVFGALLQYPGTYGHLHDIRPIVEALHAQDALAVVAPDLMEIGRESCRERVRQTV